MIHHWSVKISQVFLNFLKSLDHAEKMPQNWPNHDKLHLEALWMLTNYKSRQMPNLSVDLSGKHNCFLYLRSKIEIGVCNWAELFISTCFPKTPYLPYIAQQLYLSKQWRPRSDCSLGAVWSGSSLFAKQLRLISPNSSKESFRAMDASPGQYENFLWIPYST